MSTGAVLEVMPALWTSRFAFLNFSDQVQHPGTGLLHFALLSSEPGAYTTAGVLEDRAHQHNQRRPL